MWIFMIACYILSALSFFMLLIAFAQSFLSFNILAAGPLTFLILTSIVYLFTETLIIFFFVGTGVSVKEYTQEKHLDAQFHRASIAIKRRVYPPQMLNILLMIILFILFGVADTGRIPLIYYQLYFMICLLQLLDAKRIQHEAFKASTHNILAMSGITLEPR